MSLVRLSPDNLAEIFSSLVFCHVERAAQVSRIVVVPVACVNRLFAAVFRALALQRAAVMRRLNGQAIAAIRSAFVDEFMRDVLLHSNDAPNISAELRMGGYAIIAQENRTIVPAHFIHVIMSTRRRVDRPDMEYQDLRLETIRLSIPSPVFLSRYIEFVFGRHHAAAQRLCLIVCNNDTPNVLFESVRV